METKNCDLREAGNKRMRRWHLVVPLLALLFQLVPPVLLWAVSTAAYGGLRPSLESWERPASLLVLGISAGVSLLLGSIGVYGLLTRACPRTAALLIPACCMPALFSGAVYVHGLLVFLARV